MIGWIGKHICCRWDQGENW